LIIINPIPELTGTDIGKYRTMANIAAGQLKLNFFNLIPERDFKLGKTVIRSAFIDDPVDPIY